MSAQVQGGPGIGFIPESGSHTMARWKRRWGLLPAGGVTKDDMSAKGPERPVSGDPAPLARFWTSLTEDRIRCDLCPHRCVLREGERGRCFVRRMGQGKLEATSYGWVSGIAADPVEKKPLYHFLPDSKSLSFGVIGCNLSCVFCQNGAISQPKDFRALQQAVQPAAIAEEAIRSGCPSVSFTYNEPIVSIEFTLDVAAACRKQGLRTVAVTAGYIEPEPALEFFRAMDAANVDLKAFTDDFYRRLCGSRLAPVLDTLELIHQETDCWLELTTLIIPGENDSRDELDRMSRWVVDRLGPDVPMHFSAFHPTYHLTECQATNPETLRMARELARENGVRYAYTGNIEDPEGQSTYCPLCGQQVMERSGYQIRRCGLTDGGCCTRCKTAIAGKWIG